MLIQNNYNYSNKTLTKPQQSVNFKGLTRYFSNGFHTADELINAMEKYPKSNGIVGSLPREWVQKIQKEERTEKIKLLYSAFEQSIKDLIFNTQNTRSAEKTLNEAFKSLGIIKQKQNISLSLLSKEGSFGDIYRLDIPISSQVEKHYVIKRFRSHLPKEVKPGKGFKHGNFVEQNTAFFIQKNLNNLHKHSGMGPKTYHYGDYPNILFTDLRNAYAVFENANFLPSPTRHISTRNAGIIATDFNPDNIVSGYYVDFGGYKTDIPIIPNNKTARYIYKKIKNDSEPIKKMIFYLNNIEKIPNSQDAYGGIVAILINLYKNYGSISSDLDLSFEIQLKLVQKIFDKVYSKIQKQEIKEHLKMLLETMKIEKKYRESIDIDDLLK